MAVAKNNKTYNSAEMLEYLRRFYLPEGRYPAGLFAPEVESPCRTRRADLIWVPTTKHIPGIVGHEIKISRSDLAAELLDPAKADPWAQYCERWWLVIPDPALVDGLHIPESWGIMGPPARINGRSMAILRAAPRLQPVNAAVGMQRIIAWMMHRGNADLVEARTQLEYARRDKATLARQLEDRALRSVGFNISAETRKVLEMIAEMGRRGYELKQYVSDWDRDAVILAILDQTAARNAADSLRRDVQIALGHLEDHADTFRIAKRDLAKAFQMELKSLTNQD